jgi:hypothetical protein
LKDDETTYLIKYRLPSKEKAEETWNKAVRFVEAVKKYLLA